MASEVDIANLALTKLGDEAGLLSLADDTRAGRALVGIYADVRDATLRDHPWNFATKRAALAQDAAAVVWGGWNAFLVPVDFLRLLEIENDPDWQLEANRLLVRQPGPLNIRYTSRVTDTGRFDALFVEALACNLAKQVAVRLTGSNSLAAAASDEYKAALNRARGVDGKENPPEAFPEDDWLIAREAG